MSRRSSTLMLRLWNSNLTSELDNTDLTVRLDGRIFALI